MNDDLHNNSNVVSEILSFDLFVPPNKTATLKSTPVPKSTAVCPDRSVMAVGSDSCNVKKK